MMNNNDKSVALTKISSINAVEGFDPTPLAVEYTDMNAEEKRMRLPVMAQIAWFRLKYPEGRFTLKVTDGNDCFVASARVYKNYMDPIDCFLSEATASRGYLPDKPTVSPREWAQTAALGIALRNAGFGLQFHAAGESFDEPVVNEMCDFIGATTTSNNGSETSMTHPTIELISETGNVPKEQKVSPPVQPDADPLGSAMKMPCPISKYKDKTLGDMVSTDPKALVWVAEKFTGDIELRNAAKMICDHALAASA
jgi:hypothetical protein